MPNRFWSGIWIGRGNWWIDAVAETDGGTMLLQAESITVNGVQYSLTYGGSLSKSFAAGENGISAMVPASGFGGSAVIKWAAQSAVGLTRPAAGHLPLAALGEGGQYAATDLSAKVTDGSAIANTANQTMWEPTAIFVGGRPVSEPAVLLTGDSLAMGNLEYLPSFNTSDANGAQGAWMRYFSAQGIGVLSYTKFGYQAQNIAANWTRRGGLITAATAAIGNLPFSVVVNELGYNDITSSAATVQSRLSSAYAVFATYGRPIYQMSEFRRTTSNAAGSWYTTLAGQTIVTNYDPTAAPLQTVEAWLAAGGGGALSGYYNVAPLLDPAGIGKFDPTLASRQFTLDTPIVGGAGTLTAILTPIAGAVPEKGMGLAFLDGTAELKLVSAVSGPVGGKYTVTVTAFTNTHSAGSTVTETPTSEGVHLPTPVHARIAANIPASVRTALNTLSTAP